MARQRKRADTIGSIARHLFVNPVTPGDHEKLYQDMLLDPMPALRECLKLKIALMELPVFRRITNTHPDIAVDIVIQANVLGVTLGLSPQAATAPAIPF